jgi:hypothetical protein
MGLLVTGEAQWWLPALETIIGPQLLKPVKVDSDRELWMWFAPAARMLLFLTMKRSGLLTC